MAYEETDFWVDVKRGTMECFEVLLSSAPKTTET